MGAFVSEMGYLLSFIYINAWTSQFFIDDEENGLEKAKSLSSMITTSSMVIGLFMGLILGQVIDKTKAVPIYLLCFAFRALGLFVMTCGISDFNS